MPPRERLFLFIVVSCWRRAGRFHLAWRSKVRTDTALRRRGGQIQRLVGSDGVRRLLGRLELFLWQEGGRKRERERERERERVGTVVSIRSQCWGVCSMQEPLGGRGQGKKVAVLLLPEILRIASVGINGTLCTQLFEKLADVVRNCCINNI